MARKAILRGCTQAVDGLVAGVNDRIGGANRISCMMKMSKVFALLYGCFDARWCKRSLSCVGIKQRQDSIAQPATIVWIVSQKIANQRKRLLFLAELE